MNLEHFIFKKGFYKNLNQPSIALQISELGFFPLEIENKAGDEYEKHEHPETKLLAILDGSMTIYVDNQEYVCEKSDLIVIPGRTTHSATVGPEGCVFYWAEKII
jgi:mannose-6-phosphate isomerase-like protein (cupin superfamily)